jgi:para-nitrobenzyl esterase
MIVGSNQTEGTFFQNVTVTEAGYNGLLTRIFAGNPDAASLVNYVEFTLYPSVNYPTPDFPQGSPSFAAAIVTGDSGVVCNGENTRALLAQWVRVHGYEFNQPNPVEELRITPAAGIITNDAHTTEEAYDFFIDSKGNPLTGEGAVGLPAGSPPQWGNGSLDDAALSRIMIRYWTNFATTGDPNSPEEGHDSPNLPLWPAYTRQDPLVESLINHSLNAVPHQIAPEGTFPAKHNCGFWVNPVFGGGTPGNHLIAPSGPN